jgi:MFS family permease
MSASVDHRPSASELRSPRFRALLGAVVISETGDWLLFIALPLYALNASGSALATSTVFLAELAPAVVVGTACGPLIDRGDRRRLLAGLTAAQSVLLLPLLAAGPHRLWLIYLVAAVQAAIASITRPAQQALVPALVPAHRRARANALVEMASNAARLAGSPLGGVLLPVLGLDGLVLGDAVSFLLAAMLLARAAAAHTPARFHDAGGSRLGAIHEGLRAVRGDTTLGAALLVTFLSAVAQGLFLVLFVLFVLHLLHSGDAVVGLLRGVQAIGGVLGGVVVGVWAGRLGSRLLTVSGLAVFGVISLITWNSPVLTQATWWYAVLFIAAGIPATALSTGLITGTQDASPASTRGRVLGLMGVAEALGQGGGILTAGLLAGPVSLTALLNGQAGCYLACAAIAAIGFAHPRSPHLRARSEQCKGDVRTVPARG